MHSCMPAYVHTYIHTVDTHIYICRCTYTYACVFIHIHTYIHTYIHTCIHTTYIHTHAHTATLLYKYMASGVSSPPPPNGRVWGGGGQERAGLRGLLGPSPQPNLDTKALQNPAHARKHEYAVV